VTHTVAPYWLRDTQNWAVEQERMRHTEALWQLGELAMFCLMWTLDDFTNGLVDRCNRCYVQLGGISDVYGQGDQEKCPECFGTTFEGGYKALIIRPVIFGDTDKNMRQHSRGVINEDDADIESTIDFRVRTGDYLFRITGDRFALRAPQRVTLRTGFATPWQTSTAIGYNHARAVIQDPADVSYIIPPDSVRLTSVLTAVGRYPRNLSAFEDIRAPLIPGETDIASIEGAVAPAGGDDVPGPQGPPGTSGGSFTFTQSSASSVWLITHDLGYYPAGVMVVDSAGTEVEGEISYPAPNQVQITFAVPFSGKAYLS
jgi:hypothetical protein